LASKRPSAGEAAPEGRKCGDVSGIAQACPMADLLDLSDVERHSPRGTSPLMGRCRVSPRHRFGGGDFTAESIERAPGRCSHFDASFRRSPSRASGLS
jgi:hypothetical protein